MILAIETSDILCSVAFWDNGRTTLEYSLELPRQHAALVGSLVEKGLAFLSAPERVKQYSREDIQLLTASTGPGSFTGLRIGLSFALGYCAAEDTSIVGVSNHQILAAQRIKSVEHIFTIIEARRNEVYLAQHEIVSDRYTKIREHKIAAKEDLSDIIPAGAQLIASKDLVLVPELVGRIRDKGILFIDSARFSASFLAMLASEKVTHEGVDIPAELEPMYIRSFAGAS